MEAREKAQELINSFYQVESISWVDAIRIAMMHVLEVISLLEENKCEKDELFYDDVYNELIDML